MNNTATLSKTEWAVDNAHSEITFKVRHMMIASVSGKFEKFTASAETEDHNLAGATLTFSAETASINTNAADRDNHLRSADFFDSATYPTMTFESTQVTENSVTGNLTIKDVTKEVTLKLEHGGIGKDPWGQTRLGFTVTGKINRKDWGLNWNAALETGGVLVSDEVAINAEIQFVKKG
jgi:polyisoprenoid-binding protein YceI